MELTPKKWRRVQSKIGVYAFHRLCVPSKCYYMPTENFTAQCIGLTTVSTLAAVAIHCKIPDNNGKSGSYPVPVVKPGTTVFEVQNRA